MHNGHGAARTHARTQKNGAGMNDTAESETLARKDPTKRLGLRGTAAAVLVAIAIVSATLLANIASSVGMYKGPIDTLTAKEQTVMTLSMTSAVAAAGVSAIPGDTGGPIATQLMQISEAFVLVFGTILLEKYLMTTLGFAFFGVAIPVCCVLGIVSIMSPRGWKYKDTTSMLSMKLFLIGLLLWASIPLATMVSAKIEDTFSESIDRAIATAESAETATANSEASGTDGAENGQPTWTEGIANTITNIGNAMGAAANTVANAPKWAVTMLGTFVEAAAVMVVTSCVIPLLVPLVILWVVKFLFQGVNAPSMVMPALPPAHGLPHPQPKEEKAEE